MTTTLALKLYPFETPEWLYLKYIYTLVLTINFLILLLLENAILKSVFANSCLNSLTLEIPENGTLFRVPMSTVEYQIGHDQKLFFLPLEPQQVW